MKTNNTLYLFAVTFLAIAFFACSGGGAGKMLEKRWQWESLKSQALDDQMAAMKMQADTSTDPKTKEMLEGNYKMMTGMMEEMKKTTFEYKPDGSFEMVASMMGQSQTKKGKWALSKDNKKLIQTDDKQKTDTLSIDELTAEKLVLSGADKGMTMTITCKAAK